MQLFSAYQQSLVACLFFPIFSHIQGMTGQNHETHIFWQNPLDQIIQSDVSSFIPGFDFKVNVKSQLRLCNLQQCPEPKADIKRPEPAVPARGVATCQLVIITWLTVAKMNR